MTGSLTACVLFVAVSLSVSAQAFTLGGTNSDLEGWDEEVLAYKVDPRHFRRRAVRRDRCRNGALEWRCDIADQA
jgi:hypothetical protein